MMMLIDDDGGDGDVDYDGDDAVIALFHAVMLRNTKRILIPLLYKRHTEFKVMVVNGSLLSARMIATFRPSPFAGGSRNLCIRHIHSAFPCRTSHLAGSTV